MNEGSSWNEVDERRLVVGMRLASATGVDIASRALRILSAELLITTCDAADAEAAPGAGVTGIELTAGRAWTRLRESG